MLLQRVDSGGIIHTIVFVLQFYHQMTIVGTCECVHQTVFFSKYLLGKTWLYWNASAGNHCQTFCLLKHILLQGIIFSEFHSYHRNESTICPDTVYIVYCPENDLDSVGFQNRLLQDAGNHYQFGLQLIVLTRKKWMFYLWQLVYDSSSMWQRKSTRNLLNDKQMEKQIFGCIKVGLGFCHSWRFQVMKKMVASTPVCTTCVTFPVQMHWAHVSGCRRCGGS